MPREMTVRTLAERLKSGHPVHLLDVRQPQENAIAALPNSQLIPLGELPRRLDEVEPAAGVPVVVYCHHGLRSLTGAVYLERAGHTDVYSLAGGIDAWSVLIDPAVPRY